MATSDVVVRASDVGGKLGKPLPTAELTSTNRQRNETHTDLSITVDGPSNIEHHEITRLFVRQHTTLIVPPGTGYSADRQRTFSSTGRVVDEQSIDGNSFRLAQTSSGLPIRI